MEAFSIVASPSAPGIWKQNPTSRTDALETCLEKLGIAVSFARGNEICGEMEPNEYAYKVVNGAVRAQKMLCDGRRQVAAFYLPGDIFGLESEIRRTLACEAIQNTKVVAIKRGSLSALAVTDSAIAHGLWERTALELRRAQNHILLLSKRAPERVASFLLDMAERNHADSVLELPMQRQDIADYLGVAIETLSRILTNLTTVSMIAVPTTKQIVVRDFELLKRLGSDVSANCDSHL